MGENGSWIEWKLDRMGENGSWVGWERMEVG